MYNILEVTNSKKANKRLRIVIENDKFNTRIYHFGLDGGSTYIDHHDIIKRTNYRKRHYANPKEKYLIDNNIPSPALFSYTLLWGDSTNIVNNIVSLQDSFDKMI